MGPSSPEYSMILRRERNIPDGNPTKPSAGLGSPRSFPAETRAGNSALGQDGLPWGHETESSHGKTSPDQSLLFPSLDLHGTQLRHLTQPDSIESIWGNTPGVGFEGWEFWEFLSALVFRG